MSYEHPSSLSSASLTEVLRLAAKGTSIARIKRVIRESDVVWQQARKIYGETVAAPKAKDHPTSFIHQYVADVLLSRVLAAELRRAEGL